MFIFVPVFILDFPGTETLVGTSSVLRGTKIYVCKYCFSEGIVYLRGIPFIGRRRIYPVDGDNSSHHIDPKHGTLYIVPQDPIFHCECYHSVDVPRSPISLYMLVKIGDSHLVISFFYVVSYCVFSFPLSQSYIRYPGFVSTDLWYSPPGKDVVQIYHRRDFGNKRYGV